MKKTELHIEIVSSNITALSSMSLMSRVSALEVLKRYYSDVSIRMVNNMTDLNELIARRPDLVILGMKYLPSNVDTGASDQGPIWLSNYLDRFNINHTGSTHLAHQLELNKASAKRQVMSSGIASANFVVVKQSQSVKAAEVNLNYPLFVKPNNLGGGVGVDNQSLVYDLAELQAKTESISIRYKTDSLVEEYLPGREFSVAILGNIDTNHLSIMPIELEASTNSNGDKVLSHKVKTANQEKVSIVDEEPLKQQLEELAADVYVSLGARDYARIDIRLDAKGTPHFLEANLIPSFIAGYGSFPKACFLNLKMNYEKMMMHIVGLALNRQPRKVTLDLTINNSLIGVIN